MQQRLAEFKRSDASREKASIVKGDKVDRRYNPDPPEGGLVVRTRAKVLDGYEPSTDRWKAIFQSAVSRDNLWVSKCEHEALMKGTIPVSLQKRIARYHLVDNTRGQPAMWREDEIRELEMSLDDGKLTGRVVLKTDKGDRGYEADLLGFVETKDGKGTRFDVVAKGTHWGEGRFTRGAPEGKFPLAVTFALADGSDVADAVPPQASRGWVEGYIRRGE